MKVTVTARHANLSIAAFHEGLRRLHEEKVLKLVPFDPSSVTLTTAGRMKLGASLTGRISRLMFASSMGSEPFMIWTLKASVPLKFALGV